MLSQKLLNVVKSCPCRLYFMLCFIIYVWRCRCFKSEVAHSCCNHWSIIDKQQENKRERTHGFEGAVTRQPVGVQRFRTVLTRRDQLVQNVTGVPIVTAAQLVQTGDLHPETCHLLLQGHVHLRRKGERKRRRQSVTFLCGSFKSTKEGNSWWRKTEKRNKTFGGFNASFHPVWCLYIKLWVIWTLFIFMSKSLNYS